MGAGRPRLWRTRRARRMPLSCDEADYRYACRLARTGLNRALLVDRFGDTVVDLTFAHPLVPRARIARHACTMAVATSTPLARSIPSSPGELLISRIFGPLSPFEHVDPRDLEPHGAASRRPRRRV